MKKFLFVFGIIAVTVACSPKSTEGVSDLEAEAPRTAIMEGELLYAKKCTKCHDAKTIADYTPEQWAKILPNMTEKAKLTETETHQVTEYVNSELEN